MEVQEPRLGKQPSREILRLVARDEPDRGTECGERLPVRDPAAAGRWRWHAGRPSTASGDTQRCSCWDGWPAETKQDRPSGQQCAMTSGLETLIE